MFYTLHAAMTGEGYRIDNNDEHAEILLSHGLVAKVLGLTLLCLVLLLWSLFSHI